MTYIITLRAVGAFYFFSKGEYEDDAPCCDAINRYARCFYKQIAAEVDEVLMSYLVYLWPLFVSLSSPSSNN